MMRRAGLGTRRGSGAWCSIERAFFGRWSIVAGCAGGAFVAACGSASAQRWRDYDVLKDAVPAVPRTLRGQQLGTEVEYQALRQWGERWFRWETFGGERSTTDVAGLFAADVEIPVLFTLENWPYNFDGSFIDPSDRNNGVWTGAIDFTGLISLASDRSGASQGLLFWEPRGVYSVLSAEQYADMLVDRAPAVLFDPGRRESLKADILGTSDGIPGLLHPDSVVVMRNMLGAVPQPVMARAEELKRVRDPEDYGGDARLRGSMLTLLGTRVITTPGARTDVSLDAVLKSYPKLNADDFQSDVVSLLLDSLTPPPNHTRLLANARTLVPTGYEVFRAEGCASCHMGPYLTDNAMHRLSDWRAEEVGTAAASTAAFRPLGRGQGPALNTAPYRALATRALKLYVAPDFDPETGDPTSEGSVAQGLLGDAVVGYKTLTLRYLWGSAPYLHDGGVVALTFTSTRALAADVEASTSDGNYASGWLRLDADRVGLQLWLGGTPRVGAVDLALNVVASQAYPGVVDPTQSPAYNAALGDDYRAPSVRLELGPALSWGGLLVLPKIGIGYDFERGRMAPLVPQLILIVQAGPLYLESWHQLFLYDLFVDGAQDSYYTRNQLLLALVPKVSVGLELDLTVAVQSSAGDVRSWPFGVVTHVHGRRLHRV